MKIFEKYNFCTKNLIISKDEFRSLSFLDKGALRSDKLDGIIKEADLDLARETPSLSLSKYRAYNVNGSTTEYGSPYRMRMSMALRLAFANIKTGE